MLLSQLANDDEKESAANVKFLMKLLLGDLDGCLDILVASDNLPLAAFFARY